jgi:hypothetical protein
MKRLRATKLEVRKYEEKGEERWRFKNLHVGCFLRGK